MRGALGEKIGEGCSADIHAWAPDQIVKLFKPGAKAPLQGYLVNHLRRREAGGKGGASHLRFVSTEPPLAGLRTALTLPLEPPPQKNVSPPFDSSPDTLMPGGMSICSSTSPDCGSIRRSSL